MCLPLLFIRPSSRMLFSPPDFAGYRALPAAGNGANARQPGSCATIKRSRFDGLLIPMVYLLCLATTALQAVL
jgi:hypothetical protein